VVSARCLAARTASCARSRSARSARDLLRADRRSIDDAKSQRNHRPRPCCCLRRAASAVSARCLAARAASCARSRSASSTSARDRSLSARCSAASALPVSDVRAAANASVTRDSSRESSGNCPSLSLMKCRLPCPGGQARRRGRAKSSRDPVGALFSGRFRWRGPPPHSFGAF
jgi:hypothetical protein